MHILCIASYEKGHAFLREAKRQGASITLLTSLSLKEKAHWPAECIDEFFYMPDKNHEWNLKHTIDSVSYLARTRYFERIVPLDDFDVELGATLREHLRLPGIGESQVRLFRDKLAMRMGAQAAGIKVPEFVGVFNYDRLHEFLSRVPGPWVLKPRSLAGAIGIKKINSSQDLWPQLDALGDMQSHYLLERFVPGDVFHVDTLIYKGEFVFAVASGYGKPPMEVSHGGGIFTTRILERDSSIAADLLALNKKLLTSFGLQNGASHTEFIRAHEDGQLYFLETSARVGGAHISDLVEAATGINLWAEWAKIELATTDHSYSPPEPCDDYAGLLVSLARQEHPDTSSYNDQEIVWRMDRLHHVGLIVKSPSSERVKQLLESYTWRIQQDFGASLPPWTNQTRSAGADRDNIPLCGGIMSQCSRRKFLQAGVAAGSMIAAGRLPVKAAAVSTASGSATDWVTLGKSGVKVTRLALGTGTMSGKVQRDLGQDQFTRLVHYAYDRGIRFFETAESYGDMHRMLGIALKGIPRDSYRLMSKITTHGEVDPQTKIDELRKLAQTDYFDVMLLHWQHTSTWPTDSIRWQDGILEAKHKQAVISQGASVHGLPGLRQFPGNKFLEIAMIRMNHNGTRMDAEDYNTNGLGNVPEVVTHVKQVKSEGLGVISMKLIGEGAFTARADRQAAMKFAFRNAGVDSVTVGYKNTSEIDEAIENLNLALA